MLNEQRRIPEEKEYFIRAIFFLKVPLLSSSRDGMLGCCNNPVVCVCVCERKQLTQSKDDSKLWLNDRLGAPVF